MSKQIPGNNRHLTADDRNIIEDGLKNSMNLKDIAKVLCKDPSTISREIRKHRTEYKRDLNLYNRCKNKRNCTHKHVCGNSMCQKQCRNCNKCMKYCKDYEEHLCSQIKYAPYVCNGCCKKAYCQLKMYVYHARTAHSNYLETLSESRAGYNITPEKLIEIDEIIKEGVKRGHSIANILYENKNLIECSERTIYKYIEEGLLSIKNIDLRRKVRYKPRKNKKDKQRVLEMQKGRTYDDFIQYTSITETPIMEMDTVLGCLGSSKCLLTLYSRQTHFMFARLLNNHTQEAVINAFDEIEELIGFKTFQELFPIILTDNGSEFLDAEALEWSKTGELRTKIYYCNSRSPQEKAGIEKNHEFIRYFIPKKNSFDHLNQAHIDLMMSNINNYKRESLHMASPYDLLSLMYGTDTLKKLGITYIKPEKVTLTKDIFT